MVPEEYGEDAEEEEVRAAVVVPPLRVAAAAAAGRRVGLPQHGAVVGLLVAEKKFGLKLRDWGTFKCDLCKLFKLFEQYFNFQDNNLLFGNLHPPPPPKTSYVKCTMGKYSEGAMPTGTDSK